MDTNIQESPQSALDSGQRWYDAGSVEEQTILEAFDLLDWLLPQFDGCLASNYVGARTGDVSMEYVSLVERPPLRFGRLLDSSILLYHVLRREEARRNDASGGRRHRSPLTSLTGGLSDDEAKRLSLADYLDSGFEEYELRRFAAGYVGIDIDPRPRAKTKAAPKKKAAARKAAPNRGESNDFSGGDSTEKAILREFRAATDRLSESANSYHAALAAGVGSLLKGFMEHFEDRSFDESALTDHFYWSITFESDAFLSLLMEYFVQRHECSKAQVFEKVYGLVFEDEIPESVRAEYDRIWRSSFPASALSPVETTSTRTQVATTTATHESEVVAPEVAALFPKLDDRLAFIRGIICMAQADGNVDENEETFFVQAAVGLGLGQSELRSVMKALHEEQDPATVRFSNKQQLVYLLKEGLQIAYLEGGYNEAEQAVAQCLASSGGVSMATLDAIEDWVRDGIMWREQGNALLDLEG